MYDCGRFCDNPGRRVFVDGGRNWNADNGHGSRAWQHSAWQHGKRGNLTRNSTCGRVDLRNEMATSQGKGLACDQRQVQRGPVLYEGIEMGRREGP